MVKLRHIFSCTSCSPKELNLQKSTKVRFVVSTNTKYCRLSFYSFKVHVLHFVMLHVLRSFSYFLIRFDFPFPTFLNCRQMKVKCIRCSVTKFLNECIFYVYWLIYILKLHLFIKIFVFIILFCIVNNNFYYQHKYLFYCSNNL